MGDAGESFRFSESREEPKNTIGRKQMTEIKTPKDVVNAIKKEGIEVVD